MERDKKASKQRAWIRQIEKWKILNLIQQDDQLSSTDNDDGQINTLTREQDLLFEAMPIN